MTVTGTITNIDTTGDPYWVTVTFTDGVNTSEPYTFPIAVASATADAVTAIVQSEIPTYAAQLAAIPPAPDPDQPTPDPDLNNLINQPIS